MGRKLRYFHFRFDLETMSFIKVMIGGATAFCTNDLAKCQSLLNRTIQTTKIYLNHKKGGNF